MNLTFGSHCRRAGTGLQDLLCYLEFELPQSSVCLRVAENSGKKGQFCSQLELMCLKEWAPNSPQVD